LFLSPMAPCDVASNTCQTLDAGEIHSNAYVDQYVCSINSIAYKPGEIGREGIRQMYDTVITGKLMAALFATRLRQSGLIREVGPDRKCAKCHSTRLPSLVA
jgi:hypothetical protein